MRFAVGALLSGLVVGVLAGALMAGPAPERAVAAGPAPGPAPTRASGDPPPAPVGKEPRREPCVPAPLPIRAGQVLVVGLPEVTSPDDPLVAAVRDVGAGGIFLAGYNVVDADQVRALVAALEQGHGPAPLIATDEEGGRVSAFRGLLGPTSSGRTMAATGEAGAVAEFGKQVGERLSELGVDWNFAPVADLDEGPWDGVIGDRSYSGDPEVATAYAAAFARGLAAGGLVPTVKHFPGHGGWNANPHRSGVEADVGLPELRASHLRPFRRLIRDVPVVMLSHVTYAGLDAHRPASMSPAAYQLLRGMGFEGVAITDSVGMGAVHNRWDFPDAAVQAIRAGADAVLATDGRQAQRMRDALVRAVRRGALPERRLNEAAGRMLLLKGVDPERFTCRS